MIAAVLFGVAEMEQGNRRERQAAGIAAAKESGVYIGRVPGTTKATPRRAVELRKTGLTDGEIARALGVSRRTVQRYVKVTWLQLSRQVRHPFQTRLRLLRCGRAGECLSHNSASGMVIAGGTLETGFQNDIGCRTNVN